MRACFDFGNQTCATFKDRVTVDSRPFPSVVNRTSFEQGPLCDISVATLKVSSMCSFRCSARERVRHVDHKSVERDREPSRLPYNRILSVLQNKKIRKRTKRMIKTEFPKSSFMYQLATNHNTYMNMLLKRKITYYFSRYYRKISKRCKYANRNNNCHNNVYFQTKQCSKADKANSVSTTVKQDLKGGMHCSDANQHATAWHNLARKLALIGLKPLDVAEPKDVPTEFVVSAVSGEVMGVSDIHLDYCCVRCGRRVKPARIVACENESCNLKQRLERCKKQWYLKALIGSAAVTTPVIFRHEKFMEALSFAENPLDEQAAVAISEDHVTGSFLELPPLKVSYNKITRVVTQVLKL